MNGAKKFTATISFFSPPLSASRALRALPADISPACGFAAQGEKAGVFVSPGK
jgi:hypothetical protein